jgi:hypothetical protein
LSYTDADRELSDSIVSKGCNTKALPAFGRVRKREGAWINGSAPDVLVAIGIGRNVNLRRGDFAERRVTCREPVGATI